MNALSPIGFIPGVVFGVQVQIGTSKNEATFSLLVCRCRTRTSAWSRPSFLRCRRWSPLGSTVMFHACNVLYQMVQPKLDWNSVNRFDCSVHKLKGVELVRFYQRRCSFGARRAGFRPSGNVSLSNKIELAHFECWWLVILKINWNLSICCQPAWWMVESVRRIATFTDVADYIAVNSVLLY